MAGTIVAPDGVTWMEYAAPSLVNAWAIAHSPTLDLFAAVSYNGYARVFTSSPFAFLRSTQKFLIKIATSGQNSEYIGVERNGITSLNYGSYGGFTVEYVIYWDNTENRATKFDGVNLTYLPFTGTEY